MPEMHLKQLGFTYSAIGSFTKNTERIRKLKETGDPRYIYRNELEKACFQHDADYGDFKDLAKRAASDKFLRDKAFNIAKHSKYDGYQRGLASMFIIFLIKKSLVEQLNPCQIKILQMNFINELLKNFKNEELILHLKTISGVLILPKCK